MGGGSAPSTPDYAGAARGGVLASAESFPLQYLVNAAAQMGSNVNIGGQNYDFTGLGQADNTAAMSDQMAQTLLNIQQNYGPAYVQQSLQELQQSDPAGYAARQQLFDSILADSQAAQQSNPNGPMPQQLQDQVMAQLQQAGHLDPTMLNQVQQSVRGGQAANGNYLGNAATAQETGATVQASDALRKQQQANAQGFLQSGVSPEDVQYRRIQQALSNLGAFQNGQTPTAEFGSLSSAGNGAAPFNGGPGVNSMINPNGAQMGLNYANNLYSGGINWNQQQVNPWIAGLSGGISGLGAATNLGFNWANAFGGGGSFNLNGPTTYVDTGQTADLFDMPP